MIDTLALRVSGVKDLHLLPNKTVQIDGPEEAKKAQGRVLTDSGKASFKAQGFKTKQQLLIEGSPQFHFRGHNVISSGDATMLAFAQIRAVKEEYKHDFPLSRAAKFAAGHDMEVTRIDTPVLLSVPEGLNKAAVINGMALAGFLANHNTSVYVNESVYFDQSSQTSSLKAYDKFAQIESSRRTEWPDNESGRRLALLAQQTIRLEAVYRLKYLRWRFGGRAVMPADLSPGELGSMFLRLVEGYDLRRPLRRLLGQSDLMLIHVPRYRAIATWWQHGYDVLAMLKGDKAEYSRAHGYLRSNHSINIYGPPPTEIDAEIELGDLLTAKNFLPVPPELRADPTIFFELDMAEERRGIERLMAGAT